MADPVDIVRGVTVASVAQHLPIWTEWGVRDCGHLVHSLGCTAITHVGQELGYCSVCEVPAPRAGGYDHVAEDVRSDSIWFDRHSRQPVLIAEFERYSGKQKDLRPKMESLLLAQHRWASPGAILLLAYWSVGLVTVPSHSELRQIVSQGFTTTAAAPIVGAPAARVVFLHFVTRQQPTGELILDQIIQRGAP